MSQGPAVVSGAGSGIGRAVAVALGQRGYPLALLGRRRQPLEETLGAAGGNGRAWPCDVRDPEAVSAVAREVLAAWGAPEVVVPAAGVAAIAPLEELAPGAFRETLDTNLLGVCHLFSAFLPAMKAAGRGRLVPILSAAATRGFPGWSAYCASKWGLRGLVAALREELAGSGVGITALYPGATDTGLWDAVPGEWNRGEMVPVGEVARALLFALDAEAPALVEEIHLGPAGGALRPR
ncbi:MAG TPA: SDR family oxidoreductase [Thermoanaerobaculia bacterium]|nr:SDR family oxidoreductase [Thermoanaerobaculia bacterium]